MNKLLNTALRAGEIMLKNGSETFRVQNTIALMLSSQGIKHYDILVIGTGIVVSFYLENGETMALSKTVSKRKNNLEKISLVVKAAKLYAEGEISIEETMDRLNAINKKRTYPFMVKVIAMSLGTGLLSIGFGADPLEGLGTALIILLPAFFIEWAGRKDFPFFLSNLISGALIALFALIALRINPLFNLDKMLASVIIVLTPGVMTVTAVRDMVNGDFITGASMGIEALMRTLSLSIGVGVIFALWGALAGGIVWTY